MKTPWQYEWKRPKVDELPVDHGDESALCVTAALVDPFELNKLTTTPLLITVTLYSDDGLLGHRMLLRLFEPPSTELQSRELRWPGSMLGDNQGGGVVSIELCRKSRQSKSLTSADARDVIQLMALGIVNNVSIQMGDQPEQEVEAVVHSHGSQDGDASDLTELMLACLTSNGHVHLYKALDLLKPVSEDVDAKHEFGFGMASLLLGTDIFRRVQESLYPLSQPCGTVQLSVPLRQKETRKPRSFFSFFSHQEKGEGAEIHVWDESFWNSTVERSTAVHRTLHNIPTGMVSAFQYVVVFGRGSRIRRIRKKQQRDVVVVEGLEALQDNEAESTNDQWWQGEPETKDDAPQLDDQEPWWKSGADEDEVVETTETGGFVSFIDLHHASETRTLYLPFAPKALYPLCWGDLAFVVVLADESVTPDRCAKAMAIRVDSSRKVFFDCGATPTSPADEEMEIITADGRLIKKPACEVRRFTLIPITLPIDDHLSSTTIRTMTVSSSLSSPPSIELLYKSPTGDNEDLCDVAMTLNYLHCFDTLESSDLPSYAHYTNKSSPIPVIRTRQSVRNAARLSRSFDERSIERAWSRSFQGCSFFNIERALFFICWDGATEGEGAYVVELVDHQGDMNNGPVTCTILALEQSNQAYSNLADELYVTATADTEVSLKEPNLFVITQTEEGNFETSTSDDERGDGSNIVIDALDSISSLSYRGTESMLSPSNSPKVKRSQRLSHLEKSHRLVQKCDSWAMLGDTEESRATFESQVPVLLSVLHSHAQVFSLRHCFVRNVEATPFYHVLSWLSQREDYFTASCIALGLLGDVESWHELKLLKCTGDDDYDDDQDSLECLLDSIVPLYPKGTLSLYPRQSVVSHVADMAIGCLAKGGLVMSTILDSFLRRNTDYDSAKAELMLAAVTTRCVSREPETVNIAMGSGYEYSENSNPEDLLWALRALLSVGVARHELSRAIVLVNVAMPDELRYRKPTSSNARSPPLDFCKAMVSTIISASPDAASLLLGLVDEESRKRYWRSLSREAQLEFALIDVDDKCPLLCQEEVRIWALKCLDECVTQEASPTAVNLNDLMPTSWLRRLCEGCLQNAECDFGQILTYGVSDSPDDDDEGTLKYVTEFANIQQALTATSSSGGLDFDLIIPALLILQQREMTWNEEAVVSTQRVLDAACYMAGRHGHCTFPFDGSTVMRQCVSASNVAAGANLLGGTNGLVLSCCDILIQGAALDMATAESYILDDNLSPAVLTSRQADRENSFVITDGHRQVLWLLLNHVLNVRTFGEFRPIHMRGKVDPVFAAQACLRTWLALSSSTDSTPWLVKWLRRNLEIDGEKISPKRLACAALTRVLMWPTSDQSTDELATIMGVESTFLVQLAQSCHGLLETVPQSVAEDIIARADDNFRSPIPFPLATL